MSRPVELVVTDLDGTLWFGGAVHDATRAALEELRCRDVPVLVATARRRKSARTALAAHGLELPSVLIDGALAVDSFSDDAFFAHPFEPADARRVVEVFALFGEQPAFETDPQDGSDDGVDLVIGDRPSLPRAYVERQDSITMDLASGSFADQLDLALFGAVAVIPRSRVREMATSLDAAGLRTWVELFPNAPDTGILLVRPPGSSKWNGVVAFCERHGIDPLATLAVGDNDNDLELLDGAGTALAMATGSAAAQAAADHIVPATTEGGWAKVLDFL